ncbi:MAG: hypothetical protein HY690_21135 [Chloroflexi bacterium]|nr:hypothetical protein [Chloroflexota bacterium]
MIAGAYGAWRSAPRRAPGPRAVGAGRSGGAGVSARPPAPPGEAGCLHQLQQTPATTRTWYGHRGLVYAPGVLSLAFGLWLAYQVGMVDGLFGPNPQWEPA